MKTSLLSHWIAGALTLSLVSQAVAQTLEITGRGQDFRVYEQVESALDTQGEIVSITNRFTEIANGLHYWDEGQWKATEEVIEIVGQGAAARKGPHKVIFSPNINTAGAVDLETSDGQRFQSQIFGLSYLDTSTGESVLIAELKNSIGELVSSNQVIYPDAFTDFEADVRYTYTKEGFEQDVIFRENPPSPETYGLNPETTQLQVLTEFFDPPQPVTQGTNIVSEFLTVSLSDQKLEFGKVMLGKGKAFSLEEGNEAGLPSQRDAGHPVGKAWDTLEGRHFLIESVEFPTIAPELEVLPDAPPVEEARVKTTDRKLVQIVKQRSGKTAATPIDGNIKKLAQVTPRKGVVVDYVLLNTTPNHTFKGDETYYVSGTVTLSGVTTIEGGTVVKYTNNAQVKIQGVVDCRTGPYRPAVFTSKDDNTVGQAIPGSSGTPTSYFASPALYLDSNISDLHHLRIAHAKEAIYYDNDSYNPHRLRHVQIVHCQRGLQPRTTPFYVQNVLMHDVLTNFYNATYSVTVHGEHLTINTADKLNAATGTITLKLTNSLFINVTTFGSMQGAYNHTNASASGVLETVGAGNNYLVSGSALRNAGTTNITANLKKDLAKKTTVAPVVLTSATLTVPTTFSPIAQRDTDTPDIGYHYDPIDYAANLITVTNTTVLLTNGVAIATVGNNGFWLQDYSTLISEGSPTALNHLCRFFNVQEQSYNWGGGTLSSMQTINAYQYGNSPADAEFRFTSFDALHSSGYHLYSGSSNWKLDTLVLKDCQFGSGINQLGGSSNGVVTIQNTLFEATHNQFSGNATVSFYNNLQYRASFDLVVYTGAFTIKDNIFDQTITDQTFTTYTLSHNLYAGGTTQLLPTNANDRVVTSFVYVKGPLGNFYHWSTNTSNAGSRASDVAGLYHHTVKLEQTKETTSTVDMGFHYVAATNLTASNYVWHDEYATSNPPGGTQTGDTDGWNYVTSPKYNGTYAHQSANLSAIHQHYFSAASTTVALTEDDTLFAYIYIDAANPPVTVMLQFLASDGTSWGHRATWGADNIGAYGVREHMGALPPAVGWVRLEVPAVEVDMQGRTMVGMAYTLYNGRATWDYAGKVRATGVTTVTDSDGDGIPDYLEDYNGDGGVDSGETDWQDANDLGLKVWITKPKNNSIIP